MNGSRRLRWEGHVTCMDGVRNARKTSFGRPAGKSPLGRIKRRFKDNINLDLGEMVLEGMDWIYLA
jgi:hypothetical protein